MSMADGRLLRFDDPGWRMAGAGGFHHLPDAVIESHGGPGLLWYAAEAFGDFRLALGWRIARLEDNSGIFLRVPPLSEDLQPAIERGYEVQIDDRGLDPQRGVVGSPLHLTGAIYRIAPARRRCSSRVGEWNTFDIVARGRSITVSLNGEEVSALHDASLDPHGHIALQAHHEGSAVQFRELQLRHL